MLKIGMTLAEELRVVPVFADLAAEDLDWLASQMTPVDLAPGEVFIREGAPADRMLVLLDGEMRLRVNSGNGEATTRIFRGPMVGGMLPYSRMTHVPATFRAVTQSHGASFPADRFPEMLARIPVLGPRLVALLSDRIRDFTRLQDQQEKMAALGKISAGLAHELNNPAAAARRAVSSLREAFQDLSRSCCPPRRRIRSPPNSAPPCPQLERELAERPAASAPIDTLERSDCEEAIAQCLLRHGVTRAWDLAPALVEAGLRNRMVRPHLHPISAPRRCPICWRASPLH